MPPQTDHLLYLKAATREKKAGNLEAAIAELRQAYATAGDALSIKDSLRLPMYLQLAGRADEGWAALNDLSITWTDTGSQREIANQARIFLEKEKNFREALKWAVWHYCLSVHHARLMVVETEKVISDSRASRQELNSLLESIGMEPWHQSDDPSHVLVHLTKERDRLLTLEAARAAIERSLAKVKRPELVDSVAMGMLTYAKFNDAPNLAAVSQWISDELSSKTF